MNQCTEERFLEDVKNHKLEIVKNDGVNRHLRFRRPGSITYWFDLITWNGHLCITGDCGTYVFSRIEDMFEFFRTDEAYKKTHPERKLFINTGYWGEKLLSISQSGGYEEFSQETFEENIKKDFEEWEFDSEEQKAEVWGEVASEVLDNSHDGDIRAFDAALSFKSEHGHNFADFWEYSCKEFTFHYLWCLYAIAWGIQEYDALGSKEEPCKP